MPSFSARGSRFFPAAQIPPLFRRRAIWRSGGAQCCIRAPTCCCMWNAIGDFWWVKRWLCRWFLQDVAVVERLNSMNSQPEDSDSPMTEGTKWPSLQPERANQSSSGRNKSQNWPFRPWRTQEKRSFSRWVLPGTLPGDGKWFRWCPFCSSLKTKHQSTKAFKSKSVFNWLTGQVNPGKFLENAKSFYQTSAFASEVLDGKVAQGEFPVWDHPRHQLSGWDLGCIPLIKASIMMFMANFWVYNMLQVYTV